MDDQWEPTPGQCLTCGGRAGWWTGDVRTPCRRCQGGGWDPARTEAWFRQFVAPAQQPDPPAGSDG